MTATFEDSVLDFDINLFQQSPNNALVPSSKDKVRKAIYLTKHKMMSTDSLIRKYYDKRLSLRSLERCLLTSKEEYKQACIESMEYQEKCSVLQDEIQKLQAFNRELEQKYMAADNRHDGMQSHAKQLQLLVKQNETTIESMKIDQQLEKAHSKELEKKCNNLQGENEHLVKNICSISNIVLGKKKLTKELRIFLMKYKKSNGDNNCESGGVSCDEADAFEDPMSPISNSGECNDRPTQTSPIGDGKNKIGSKLQSTDRNEENTNTRDDNDQDSECSNEVISLDTGRGSSLAFSDSDKCFNSPDYFDHHSPLNADPLRNKDTVTVDVATSPIPIREFANIATSPVIFKDSDTFPNKGKNEMNETLSLGNRTANNCTPITIDRVVSPIITTHYVEMSTSPVRNLTNNVATSPFKTGNKTTQDNNLGIYQNAKEKECLELNNSGILEDENSSDSEIQMILHTMRFNKKLITPIPTTPAKSRSLDVSKNNATQTIFQSNGCPDAAKLRQDNIALQATVAKLAQDVLNISNFLNQFNPSLNNDALVCTKGIPQILSGKCEMEPVGSLILHDNQNDELVVTPCHVTSENTEFSDEDFHNKISKLKEKEILSFDETCLPSASDALPLLCLANRDAENAINDHQQNNNNLQCKERLHFEDPPLDQGSVSDDVFSDSEFCESEIIIELTPDSHESDRHKLHELLLKQTEQKKEEISIKNTPKMQKLTKLQRLRKGLMPKSKIKTADVQSKRKKRVQPLCFKMQKDKISRTNRLMNNRAAFERACKVMSELKSNEKASLQRTSKENLKSAEHTNTGLSSVGDDRNKQTPYEKSCQSIETNNVIIAQKSESHVTITTSEDVYPVETEISSGNTEIHNKTVTTPKLTKTIFNSHDRKNGQLSGQRAIRTRSQSKSIDHNYDIHSHVVIRKPEENTVVLEKKILTGSDLCNQTSQTHKIYGRNQSKRNIEDDNPKDHYTNIKGSLIQSGIQTAQIISNNCESESRKRLKRKSDNIPDVVPKRMLRSSNVLGEASNHDGQPSANKRNSQSSGLNDQTVSYDDLDIFDSLIPDKQTNDKVLPHSDLPRRVEHPKFSIFCKFLDKYAKKSQKAKDPKISENETNGVCKKLEEDIAEIQKLSPKDAKLAMDELVQHLQGWTTKHLLSGLIKYLKEPNRKIESFNKIYIPPAPSMTKAEQILIYVITQLKATRPNIVNHIMDTIEYTLFMLNRTPEFEVIENLSHFYAVLCRYEKNKSRLRQFVIDAMYCLSYKSVPLIRQCLDVWLHVLPLAHMGIAKSPLVMCLVYLLHFYKCEDRFNRVQDIRNILHRKYFYEVSEWNETRILEMFRNAIIELRDIPAEKKMLRISLIVLAKRHGARWCQNNIIKNMLQPIIADTAVSDRIRAFCVSLLGPLLKPYPVDMKLNCEIIMNQLLDMLNRNPSQQLEEAIFTSLIFMSKHNHHNVIKALLFWSPVNISPEFEELLKNYVRERPAKSWKLILSKLPINRT